MFIFFCVWSIVSFFNVLVLLIRKKMADNVGHLKNLFGSKKKEKEKKKTLSDKEIKYQEDFAIEKQKEI